MNDARFGGVKAHRSLLPSRLANLNRYSPRLIDAFESFAANADEFRVLRRNAKPLGFVQAANRLVNLEYGLAGEIR